MELVKISDVCKISNGFAFKSDKYTTEAGARVIRITNVQKGKILDNDPKIYPFSELSKLDNYKIFENDILMSLTGNVGRVGKFPKELLPAYINQRICRVMPKSDNLDANYLFHFLNNDKFENDAIKNSAGAAQLNLSTNWLSTYKIPIPPLETQKHIAQILDDAATLRDKTRQLIKEYDALAQSIFLDMFGDPVKNDKGWEKVSLINLCKKIQIGPFGSQLHQADYKDCGIPLINPTNIKNGKVDYSKIAFISEKKYMSLPNYHLQVGDVLMARRGDLSKIGLVIDEKCFCGTGSLFLRPNQKLHPIYAISVLAHKSTIDKLYEKAQGITMANLNKSIVSSLEVTVPPITLQNQFAEKITLIEQQKELAKQELKESEDLFNCLLQKAFKGELV